MQRMCIATDAAITFQMVPVYSCHYLPQGTSPCLETVEKPTDGETPANPCAGSTAALVVVVVVSVMVTILMTFLYLKERVPKAVIGRQISAPLLF